MAQRPRISTGAILLTVILFGLLVFALWGLRAAWLLGGNTAMGFHGWVAMGLAAAFTLGLGGGLMWLAFYSARKGYDDRQGDESVAPEDDPGA